jgi:hypothetical protein
MGRGGDVSVGLSHEALEAADIGGGEVDGNEMRAASSM